MAKDWYYAKDGQQRGPFPETHVRQLAAASVQEFTKQLFGLRQALLAQSPAAGRIAALSTDRGAVVPVHPGAAVYYDASETSFLERYSDLTWLILFGFSSVAWKIATQPESPVAAH